MKRIWCAAALAAFPGLCLAATGGDFMARVPPLPAGAAAAYAMWTDNDGDLKAGAQYGGLETAMQNTLTTGMPGQNQAAAQKAQDMAAHYNTPQGQAELKNMSMAQKMAFAQQMQANMGLAPPPMTPTAVSAEDGALVRQAQPYPGAIQVTQKTAAIRQSLVALEGQWDKDAAAIDAASSAEMNKLPMCRGEAGEPSSLAIKTVAVKYADRKIALADSYLVKGAGIAAQYRQTVAPEVAHDDAAAAAWARIGNPTLKSQMMALARGAEAASINDASGLLGLTEDISKKAAKSVAERKRLDRIYAGAKGC